MIDFDFCSPGPRIWDIAYFATRAVPLTADTPDNAPSMAHAQDRVETILSAYGRDRAGPTLTWDDVLRVAIERLDALAGFSRRKAAELMKPGLGLDADSYDRDAEFLRSC